MINKIKLVKGDITQIEADVIVNAANSSLLGGGGVDGAIHRAGGPEILEACRQIRARQGGCATGEAVITTAGKLPAQYVIHTVGPVWTGKDQEKVNRLLSACYSNSLQIAAQHQLNSIAFPNISTGIYRFPKSQAAEIAIRTVQEFLSENDVIDEVIFVCFDDENYNLYSNALN